MLPNIQSAISTTPSFNTVPQYHNLRSSSSKSCCWRNRTCCLPSSDNYGNDLAQHQMTILPYIYISSKTIHSAQILIVGNAKEEVKIPSLPIESWEVQGEDKTEEQQVHRAAGKRSAQTEKQARAKSKERIKMPTIWRVF